MSGKTLHITLPDAPEQEAEVLQFLKAKGISTQELETREEKQPSQKDRLIKLYREKHSLPGWSKEMKRLRREFREDFEMYD